MRDVSPDRRGLVSGLLSLARNLGLITGASLMAAIFAAASGFPDVTFAPPDAVASGMRGCFAAAASLIGAILIGVGPAIARPVASERRRMAP